MGLNRNKTERDRQTDRDRELHRQRQTGRQRQTDGQTETERELLCNVAILLTKTFNFCHLSGTV